MDTSVSGHNVHNPDTIALVDQQTHRQSNAARATRDIHNKFIWFPYA